MNNPLNLTDPSGYLSFSDPLGVFSGGSNPFPDINRLGDNIGATLGLPFGSRGTNAVYSFLHGAGGYQVKSAVISAASVFCFWGAWACNAGGQYALARGYGASESDAFKTGLIAGISTGAFQLAGGVGGQYSPERYLAHAGAGCVSAVAGGGNCGQGAVSAVFGKFVTNELSIGGKGLQYDIANGVIAVTAGGIGSVIAGGKFQNGAVTAAYGYLFNGLLTQLTRPTIKQTTVAVGVLATIKASFDTDGIYDEGHKAGEAFAQKQADASATALARIEKNEDVFTTQKSAYQVSRVNNYLDVAATLASSLGDRNPVKSYYFVKGFNRGYTDCVCVGVSRDK
jgi:hypothetical protein